MRNAHARPMPRPPPVMRAVAADSDGVGKRDSLMVGPRTLQQDGEPQKARCPSSWPQKHVVSAGGTRKITPEHVHLEAHLARRFGPDHRGFVKTLPHCLQQFRCVGSLKRL